jgi:hypothetical protein
MSHATIAFGAIEEAQGSISFESGPMSMRRMVYWWFWFVASGRFLRTFLTRPRVKRP